MRKTILITLTAISASVLAVFETTIPDAVSAGVGDIRPEIGTGPTSMFLNYNLAVGGGYRRSFNYADFDEISGYASLGREKLGVLSMNLSAFSADDLSSETKLSLGYLRNIFTDIHTSLSLAGRANLHSLSYERSIEGMELGSSMGASFDFAGEAIVYKRTKFRVLARNVTATNMGIEGDIEVPRGVSASVSYSPYTATDMIFFLDKTAGKDHSFGIGLSANPHEIITFRLGAATVPDRVTAGIGIKYKTIRFDYAIKSHPVLPLSHTISLGFEIAK